MKLDGYFVTLLGVVELQGCPSKNVTYLTTSCSLPMSISRCFKPICVYGRVISHFGQEVAPTLRSV